MLTAEEEGRAWERRNRIQLHVHRALGRSQSISEFFRELVSVHAREYPELDLSPFHRLDVDELDELRARVRLPLERAGGLVLGMVYLRAFDAGAARPVDLFLDAVPSTAASPYLEWPGYASLELLGSRVVGALEQACEEGPSAAGTTLVEGWMAKLAAQLLARPSGLASRDVFVGVHQTTPLFIGRVDEGGFIATPPSIAGARLRDQRAHYAEAIVRMKGPPVAARTTSAEATDEPRALVHPDGRRWEIRVDGERLQLRFTDEDGDEHTRTRASSDPRWEAATLIRDQLLEGFVDA